jgi:hypothetical protein
VHAHACTHAQTDGHTRTRTHPTRARSHERKRARAERTCRKAGSCASRCRSRRARAVLEPEKRFVYALSAHAPRRQTRTGSQTHVRARNCARTHACLNAYALFMVCIVPQLPTRWCAPFSDAHPSEQRVRSTDTLQRTRVSRRCARSAAGGIKWLPASRVVQVQPCGGHRSCGLVTRGSLKECSFALVPVPTSIRVRRPRGASGHCPPGGSEQPQ